MVVVVVTQPDTVSLPLHALLQRNISEITLTEVWNTHSAFVVALVRLVVCFDPSQSQRITPGQETNGNVLVKRVLFLMSVWTLKEPFLCVLDEALIPSNYPLVT